MYKIIELKQEDAGVVSIACEVYARVKMGQFTEVIWHCLDITLNTDEYCRRRDMAEKYLLAARTYIYPELYGIGHSYGIGKFRDADLAFDVHQVIRHTNGDPRSPFSFQELPKLTCQACQGEIYMLEMPEEQLMVVADACKFYSNIRFGQFEEIIDLCLDESEEDYEERRSKCMKALDNAKECLCPEAKGKTLAKIKGSNESEFKGAITADEISTAIFASS